MRPSGRRSSGSCKKTKPSPGGRCPSAHTGADEGNATSLVDANSEETKICLEKDLPPKRCDRFRYPSPHPSRLRRATFPQGKAFRRNSHRQPTNGARRSAVLDGAGHVNRRHPYQPVNKSLSDSPVLVTNKGVLRTVGSKLIFAYFCSATKVGRRRHNTKRYTVGYRQKRPALVREAKPPSSSDNPPSPLQKKRLV